MSCHSLLAWRVSIEDQLLSLWESSCVLFIVFPLLLLIFVLCVWSLLIWLISPWVYPFFGLCVSWTCVIISFLILGKFSTIISSIFSWSFFLSSSSRTPMIQMLGLLTLSQRSLKLFSFLSIHFFFSLCFIDFYHSIFYLTYPIFCLCYSTLGSLQSVFFISFIALLIIYLLFF